MQAIGQICNRVVHMEHGEIVDDGPPDGVIERYLAGVGQAS